MINFEFLSKLHLNQFSLMIAKNKFDDIGESEIQNNKKYLQNLKSLMVQELIERKTTLDEFAQALNKEINSMKEMLMQEKLGLI